MSVARKSGDIVWKMPGAGFIGQASWVVIVDEGEPREELFHCFICDNPDCAEWPTAWGLPGKSREEAEAAHRQGQYTGSAYHISECQMLDAPAKCWPGIGAGTWGPPCMVFGDS